MEPTNTPPTEPQPTDPIQPTPGAFTPPIEPSATPEPEARPTFSGHTALVLQPTAPEPTEITPPAAEPAAVATPAAMPEPVVVTPPAPVVTTPIVAPTEPAPVVTTPIPPTPVVTTPTPATPSPTVEAGAFPPVVVSGGMDAQASSAGLVMGQPIANAPGAPQNANSAKPKRSMKLIALIVVGVLVVVLGSSAALAAVIIPNEPSNVLKLALLHSVEQPQISFNGTLSAAPTVGSGLAYTATIVGEVDETNKAADITTNVTIEGATIPVEARYVGQNAYFKFGDLSTIATLAGIADPQLGTILTTLNSAVANKWIEVDSTLIDTAGGSCYANADWNLTSSDDSLIKSQFLAHDFIDIISHSADTVSGQSSTKYTTNINDNMLSSFTNGLSNLSVVKKINSCDASKSTMTTAKKIANNQLTPLSVWVNKSTKRINKVSYTSTAAESKQDNETDSLSLNMSYGSVSITAPTGALPVETLIAQLQTSLGASGSGLNLTDLLLGAIGSGSTPTTSANGTETVTD